LVAKEIFSLHPLIEGGGQERGHRSGTENVPGIIGLGAALHGHSFDHMHTLKRWHQSMEEDLENFCSDVHIYGKDVDRLPNTTALAMPFVESATQVMHFDLAGIAVSMGAACSSGRTQISRSLQKMGSNPKLAQCAIRISSGWNTKEDDLKKFTHAWKEAYTTLKKGKSS
jgi:cysteine desulfurase